MVLGRHPIFCEVRSINNGFNAMAQFLACAERYNSTGCNGDFFAGFGIATGSGRLIAGSEITKAGQAHVFPGDQCLTDFLEKPSTNSFASRLLKPITSLRNSASSALLSADTRILPNPMHYETEQGKTQEKRNLVKTARPSRA